MQQMDSYRYDYVFLEKMIKITVVTQMIQRITYEIQTNADGEKKICFSNGEEYDCIEENETQELFIGEESHGELQNKILKLGASPKSQVENTEEIGFQFIMLDGVQKKQFTGIITEYQIVQQSEEVGDFEETGIFIKNNFHKAFDKNSPIELQKNDENYEMIMKMSSTVDLKTVPFSLNVTLQQTDDPIENIENEISLLKDQLIVEKVKCLIPGSQLCDKIQLAHFKEIEKNKYITNPISINSSEFEFIIQDEEIKFSVGILEDGKIENMQYKIKSYFIDFPDGKLTRGQEDAVSFFSRPVFRNDQISLKVIRDKSLFIVLINGQAIPPIKLKEDFKYSFMIFIKDESKLSDIISEEER